MSRVVVLGASPDPGRFSHKAIRQLVKRNYDVVAIGKQKGFVGDIPIETGQPPIQDVHTILIYLSPLHQGEIFDYVLSLKPKRVIFNPGTESPEFEEILISHNILVVHDCSLVMMAMDRF